MMLISQECSAFPTGLKPQSKAAECNSPELIVPQKVQEVFIVPTAPATLPFNNEANQDVFVMDTQLNEKESRRELIDFKQRMLIEQDLMRIENYINEVINTL